MHSQGPREFWANIHNPGWSDNRPSKCHSTDRPDSNRDVAGESDITVDEAFDRLRRHSQNNISWSKWSNVVVNTRLDIPLGRLERSCRALCDLATHLNAGGLWGCLGIPAPSFCPAEMGYRSRMRTIVRSRQDQVRHPFESRLVRASVDFHESVSSPYEARSERSRT